MLKENILGALNKQMNAEFYNSHLYLGMAAWFESQNLPGCAHWMKLQAEEERGHALRFYKHIVERRGTAKVDAVKAPPAAYKSPLAAFEAALAHEDSVSATINDIISSATDAKDYATVSFLQWFVNEQVEEEAQTDAIVQQLRMAGESKGGLMQIDHHLGKRAAG